MSLRTQFESLLRPQPLERFADQMVKIKVIRSQGGDSQLVTLGPFPSWFTLYELKLMLWNHFKNEAVYAPPLVFIGLPVNDPSTGDLVLYEPLEIVWRNLLETSDTRALYLANPLGMIGGPPDARFVDSTGAQKAMGRDNRISMTFNDVFRLSDGHTIPELHAFLYVDIIDKIPGLRPLGERDIYGRIVPYFPFLDISSLPSSTDVGAVVNSVLQTQANQTTLGLQQIIGLEGLLKGRVLPSLDGVKLLRWVWNPVKEADGWEDVAVFFFGVKVTHERPFMRYFPASGQALTKVKVKGSRLLPIPDVPDPNLLLLWKNDKPPESGKEVVYMKLRIQDDETVGTEIPVFSTMIVFEDGTAELRIQPPKKIRVLDPLSDLQDAPDVIERAMSGVLFMEMEPKLDKASVVCKLRLKREDTKVNRNVIKSRLSAFNSIFQEIPALPDEAPLVMLRYKGVSNFTNETRIFAFLTLLSERDMNSGEMSEESWETRVAQEFKISLEEAKKQVDAWKYQRGEFALAVSDTKDYILNKNPGVDIAIFEQHPVYTFHIYSDQDITTYKTILNFLSLLITAKPDELSGITVKPIAAAAPTPGPSGGATIVSVGDKDKGIQPGLGEGQEEQEEEEFAFEDDEIPEFMKGTVAPDITDATKATGEKAEVPPEEEEFAFNDEDIPEFMRGLAETQEAEAEQTQVEDIVAATATAPMPVTAQEDDKDAAKAFGKPTDISAIQVSKYYIERLKLADRKIFNYEKDKADRSYVSHCAANESRQPIVLDRNEYDEMRQIYKADKDIQFICYPDDAAEGAALVKKGQPTEAENRDEKLGGQAYPSESNKEVVTLVKYGSSSKRIHYYFCPRLFCIRDRLMIRYKDFKSGDNRFKLTQEGLPSKKPVDSCPFCSGKLIKKDEVKNTARNVNNTVLERKKRPGSESERNIYIGFLDRKTPKPPNYSLPCCFATTENRFNADDPEFTRLGLRGQPAAAQPIADAIMGKPITAVLEAAQTKAKVRFDESEDTVPAAPVAILQPAQGAQAAQGAQGTQAAKGATKYAYYLVIQGVSVKSIVDSSRTPLRIIEPRSADDPKAGPQIGFLSEDLDKYFNQDSTSDKFAERIEIVSKLKPSAQGFLRLAVDNSNKQVSLLSAIAPFLGYLPNAESVIDQIFGDIESRIPPKKFMQINGGNLVHEFFDSCPKKNTNEMRAWAFKHLGISELKSSNIPAIERLMNSYECFKLYIKDPNKKKDMRVFFDILSEPSIMGSRGIIFIVIEMTVEEVSIKHGDKVEFKTEVKFKNIRCPKYPLNEGQQKADIGFLVHYNRISRDRYSQDISYSDMGWDILFYVDGTKGSAKSRHKPVLFFQRTLENSEWPAIVQQRVFEFFNKCLTVNRGPFTSEFGVDPYALISVKELITAVRVQPKGIIRDAYNHLVAIAYKVSDTKSQKNGGIIAIPVSDDGTVIYEGDIYLDWDDFMPAGIDRVIEFYTRNINPIFPQYNGYIPVGQIHHTYLNDFAGVRLKNGLVIPASNIEQTEKLAEYPVEQEPIEHFDWDINNTIAYDAEMRREAFKHADVGRKSDGKEADAEIKDPKDLDYMKIEMDSSQNEIEDVYQHLRLTFSSWLSTGAGSTKRARLEEILENNDSPLSFKRKQVDILLYNDIFKWLEPSEDDTTSDIGFLRVDCQIQGESDCKGRCKWAPKETDNENCGPCKIHTPKANGVIMNVPRMLYLRLVDELIRYAAKRREIFNRQVPRLTIRKEAQLLNDQFIIPEGTSDWNTWWEKLRVEWMYPEKAGDRHFDEQYVPIATGLPVTDVRTLPQSLKDALGPNDPKVAELVWNPSTTPDRPFSFLRSILRFNDITAKTEPVLDKADLDMIKEVGNVQILYMPSGKMEGSIRSKKLGAMDALIITSVNGTVGWISQKGVYGLRIPIQALPDSLNSFRLI